ncbi:SRPBCC domain-containing protein [Kytococcus sedentarius]|uniref:SRPBCC domain-containing protein n=1 Tax=Kytococcus sedentarius TaxID=1276 RepID=UPI00031C9B5C|nr:SRPBCC domain-containing protein [Kytococcus sedentarius]QQB63742.1 SRPBCC domain-containing protein [Kytococcus sedentarius]STX13303.1 Activator of Hsp90 ATPase homolog 1-like protein [Kytococcus sedentarius]
MSTWSCGYTVYVDAPAQRLWTALTDAEETAIWWRHSSVSDWHVGSDWQHVRVDGSGTVDGTGTVREASAPHRLAFTFPNAGDSRVAFDLAEHQGITRLTLTHTVLPSEHLRDAVARV